MKLLIASDIHGSYTYCKKLIDIFDNDNFDYLVLLGDILYHGPRNDLPMEYDTKKVAKLLNERKNKIIAVRGNCDSEVDQMVLDFNVSEPNMLIMNNDKKIFLTHGHKYGPTNFPPLTDIDYLFSGHTHIKMLETINNVVCMNPGSVSIPKDGSHSYAVMDNDNIELFILK